MKQKKIVQALLLLSFAIIAVAYWLGSQPTTPIEIGENTNLDKGQTAPDFKLLEHKTGAPIALSDFSNEVVMVNFWASWCPPCIEEIPSLLRFSSWAKRELGMTVLAPSVDEDVNAIDKMFSEKKFWPSSEIPFTILIDTAGQTAVRYGVSKFPDTFVIKNGIVLRKFSGPQDWMSKEIRQWFSDLYKK